MIIDMNYWSKVFKKIIILILSVIFVYFSFKFSIFYLPFLIAFTISLLIEPIIKFNMKHMKLRRKTSAIIVFAIVLTIIIGLLSWGIFSLISESSNLLNGLNEYIEKVSLQINNIFSNIDLSKLHLSDQIITTLQKSTEGLLDTASVWIKNVLTNLLNFITSIPNIGIYTVITILALYFICTDKIYMLDQLEHHLPEIWVKRIGKHIREITKSLGCYLKAQAILVLTSFVICLIGLYILKFAG